MTVIIKSFFSEKWKLKVFHGRTMSLQLQQYIDKSKKIMRIMY